MSVSRRCPNCFQKENVRANFGDNVEAERAFHAERWCTCGYNSPMEMMADQDMVFKDPKWIPIAKYFIISYHFRIQQGRIHSSEELVRFFLRLLKDAANRCDGAIELVERKQDVELGWAHEGKAAQRPRASIFKDLILSDLHFTQKTEKQRIRSKFFMLLLCLIIGVAIGFGIGKVA